jgi:hypothetical protein
MFISQLLVFLYVCGALGSDTNYKKVASRFAISFTLAFKPSIYSEEYWYRKGGYALHCLLICDDEMRILDCFVGYLGNRVSYFLPRLGSR